MPGYRVLFPEYFEERERRKGMFGINTLKQKIRIVELAREYNEKRIKRLEDKYYDFLKHITALENYLGITYVKGPSHVFVKKEKE